MNLPQDMVRVEVINVLNPFLDLKVGDADCYTLGLCKGFFLKWRKDLVLLKVYLFESFLSYLLFEALILAQLFVLPKHMCTNI